MSGRSVAWLARLFRVQEVVSSNLTAPTIFHIEIRDFKGVVVFDRHGLFEYGMDANSNPSVDVGKQAQPSPDFLGLA